MINVRIRHVNDAKPVHLMTWPAEHIDRVLPTLAGWGLRDGDTGGLYSDLTGQIVVEDGEAFFEVLYGEEDDSE